MNKQTLYLSIYFREQTVNENILKIIRPSILGFLPGFLVPFALLFIHLPPIKPLLISAFWILEVLIFLNAVASVYSAKYKIGSTRLETVIFTRNTFSLDTTSINYSNIQEINVHQSITQRLFGIGDITIDTAGVGKCLLKGIEEPVSIMNFILELKGGTK